MRIFRCCTPLLVALILMALSLWRTDFFSVEKIQVPLLAERDLPCGEDFEWPLEFKYLGRGRQCFAFVSLDGQYVLKFFNRTQLVLPWQRHLPEPYRKKEMGRFVKRVQIYPESYRLALEKMPEETGLLVVHQGLSTVKYPMIELVDKASRKFFVDLNQVPFVLQKKGSGKFLHRLLQSQSSQEFDTTLERFFSFHSKRIGLYIADGDRDIKRNYAWDAESLLYVDPARFMFEKNMSDPSRYNREWWGVTYRLRRKIALHWPEKLEYFDKRVDECKRQTYKSFIK